ncbi:hypothetical protein [Alkalilimnicola ehrlichii]|uniref:Uncharacterized protein n=1 Tax=Alkalilimnicola ehrlichii TaxID=351052 RepID=A0A3E0WG45_9GAMM|nr:hypothetical protein [Alkalilimnicola ehrlichii]RFA31924.1 hypothetical protein CAL65_20965 [Alkalilimnicola ehrlichii]
MENKFLRFCLLLMSLAVAGQSAAYWRTYESRFAVDATYTSLAFLLDRRDVSELLEHHLAHYYDPACRDDEQFVNALEVSLRLAPAVGLGAYSARDGATPARCSRRIGKKRGVCRTSLLSARVWLPLQMSFC